MPTKTPWLNISVLLLHNFVKESQTRASYFQINSLSMNWFAQQGNESSLFGKFPFSEPFMWTMDWHNTQCELIIKRPPWHQFNNSFLFIQNYHACKTRSNYAGMKFVKKTKTKYLVMQVMAPMQLQNRWLEVVNWEGTAAKCTTMKKARWKRANLLVFQLKYAKWWRSHFLRRHGYLSSL